MHAASAESCGTLIARRFPVERDTSDWARDAPVLQALVRAVVRCPGGDVAVIAVHIPNGHGYSLATIETFEALARGICRSK